MRRIARYIALTVCLMVQHATWGQVPVEPVFGIGVDGKTCSLHFRLGSFGLAAGSDGYASLNAAGLATTGCVPGAPALPTASRLLMLPEGASLTVEALEAPFDTLCVTPGALPLQPAAPAVAKDAEPLPAVADPRAFAAPAAAALQVENLGTMGRRQLFRLTVHPFAYDHGGRTVAVRRRISATLTVASAGEGSSSSDRSVPLLVVSREEFRQGLQPFVRWKRQEGFAVSEIYVATHRRDSIRPLIAAALERYQGEALPYLLLVGDVAKIQAYIGNNQPPSFDNHITDLRYADLNGDFLPDLVCGRWPVNDTAELGAVVRKTLRYEQCTDLDSNALRRVMLVAGNEDRTPAPVTTNGEVNYLKNEVLKSHPDIDTVCYYNPASAGQRTELLHDIGVGHALLAYSAHCTDGGWNSPQVQAGHVDSAAAAWPSVWVNNCCRSNSFGGTCFGEQLLRMSAGGAVAVIGATNNTMWNEDYYWAVGPKYPFSLQPGYDSLRTGAFDALWDEPCDRTTVGGMLLAGNLAVTASGSPYERFYWETYCLLGDPTLRPQIGVPQESFVAAADSLRTGASTATLVGTPGAVLTLVQADSLLGTAVADSAGAAVMELRWCIDTGAVVLTATGCGLRPSVVSLDPGEATSKLAVFDLCTSDSAVVCTVANLGQTPLAQVRVALVQGEGDTVEGAPIATEQAVIDTLAARQRVRVVVPCRAASLGQKPWWKATLLASADGDSAAVRVRHALPAERPVATFVLRQSDGAPARSLHPSSDYRLVARAVGQCDSMSLVVTALPGHDTLFSGIAPTDSVAATFTTPGEFTHLVLALVMRSGHWIDTTVRYLEAGGRRDGMESGMATYPWRTSGTLPWTVDDDTCREGTRSLRSGAIDYRQTSDLLLDLHLMSDDTLTYWARTSSEAQYDKLTFCIDGLSVVAPLSGESGWRSYRVPVAAGKHTLRWRYVKDESTDEGNDCAWIDDVRLPLSLWEAPYGGMDSGPQQGIDRIDTGLFTGLSATPNPTIGQLTVDGEGDLLWVEVVDLYGRPLFAARARRPMPARIDLEGLCNGIYLLRMASTKGICHQTLIIQR